MSHSRFYSLLGSASVAACLIGATGLTAAHATTVTPLAMTTHSWSLSGTSTVGSNPGSMTSNGTLVFTSKHDINWEGSVNDVCPADGVGAMVRVLLGFANGTEQEITIMVDNTTCSGAGISGSETISKPNKKIASASVELDEESGGTPGTTLDYTNQWNNPYT